MGERRAGKRLEFQSPITYAAGLAVRFYKDLEELRDQLGVTRGEATDGELHARTCISVTQEGSNAVVRPGGMSR